LLAQEVPVQQPDTEIAEAIHHLMAWLRKVVGMAPAVTAVMACRLIMVQMEDLEVAVLLTL
jgi:hypothetical protein